jgi:REP element-mobilizing transposase RayT
MKLLKQIHFFKELNEKPSGNKTHGGILTKGKRKIRRPLDTQKPLHLVMRSSKARGELNFLKVQNRTKVENIVRKQAAKFGIRIASFANVGNHLHLLLRISNRKGFQAFLKSTTALIARAVTKARKGNPFGKFWDTLAYTRILTSSKELAVASKYLRANQIEARQGTSAREMFLASRRKWELKLYSG